MIHSNNFRKFRRHPFGLLVSAFAILSLQSHASASGSLTQQNFYTALPVGLTHDHDTELLNVMPDASTKYACQRYWAAIDPKTEKFDPQSQEEQGSHDAEAHGSLRALYVQEQMILCGKWLFFYLPVPTQVAVPDVLLQSLQKTFPEITGRAFVKLGFRENPLEPGQPLELPVVPRNFSVVRGIVAGPGRTLACTACHLGSLPDGRYSVGMPNDKLDLGLFNTLSTYPLWLASRLDTQRNKLHAGTWDGVLNKRYENMFEASKGRFNFPRALLDAVVLLDLLNLEKSFYSFVGQDPLPLTDQRTFYKSGRGRLNPSTPMLSEPQHEIYVSSPPIWQMKHFTNSDMGEPYLGRVVSSRNLEEFIRQAFVFTTLETRFSTPKYVDPIAAYLRTLSAPKNPVPVDSELFTQGRDVFSNRCARCHNGYEGATRQNHALAEVNSPQMFDELFKDYMPPTRQSKLALTGLQQVGMLPLERRGIKSRRLTGIWARNRLTTAGTIEGIDHLLCLSGKSRLNNNAADPLSDGTHAELCENFNLEERNALAEYLRHF